MKIIYPSSPLTSLSLLSLASQSWQARVFLTLTNHTHIPVTIHWISYSGAIEGGGEVIGYLDTWTQLSFLSHSFIVIDEEGKGRVAFTVLPENDSESNNNNNNSNNNTNNHLLNTSDTSSIPDELTTSDGEGERVLHISLKLIISETIGIVLIVENMTFVSDRINHSSSIIHHPSSNIHHSFPNDQNLIRYHSYTTHTIHNCHIHFHTAIETPILEVLIQCLSQDLSFIQSILPSPALSLLSSIHIYVNSHSILITPQNGAHRIEHGICFHKSKEWLLLNGNSLNKQGHIEIYRCIDYIEWRKHQPAMILHEFSHAYHFLCIKSIDEIIMNTYHIACESHLYDSVPYILTPNTNQRHYGLTNSWEFFAEMSEAYWWRNDYYPYTRRHLARIHRTTFQMIEKVWGVTSSEGCISVSDAEEEMRDIEEKT